MNVSAVTNAVLVLALVGWVLYRQTIARPVTARSLLLLPGILAVIGIAAIGQVDGGVTILAANAGVANVSSAALELALGVSLLAQNGVVALRGSRRRLRFAPDGTRRGGRGMHSTTE
jgi:hypothetical protein